MTLTEQWKKGELPEGYYYFKMPDGAIEIASEYRLIRYNLTKDAEKIEVLAPVPSYEEWQELKEYKRIVTSYNMKPIDYDIACETVNKLLDEKEKLRNELGLLKESIGKDCGTHYTNLFLQENKQLKELLKECREEINKAKSILTEDTTIDNTVVAHAVLRKLLAKIDEVLK